MTDIKVEQTNIKVEDNDSILVTPTTNIPVVIDASNRVTVSPRSYHIVSPDIYTIKRNNAPDPWFQSLLDNAISGSDLADEVSDLGNQFDNFESGVTLQIGYLQDADVKLAYDISINKVANDNNTAGISHLNVTKVTADEATAISQATIGAWSNGGEGGAWFDSKVSTVSNVAYSAAKSASTLTASINSQQDQMNLIVGDIDVLQSQVDGKVETWFGHQDVVDGSGDLIPTAKPYVDWADPSIHTGDTYVKTETNPTTQNEDIIASWTFIYDTAADKYVWLFRTDDTANKALQDAANAQATADGKIVTFYQDSEPTALQSSLGDLWLEGDNNNKMYRYDGVNWTSVDDTRIEASVTRLDEVSVDVNGEARAKSSLSVDANGVIGGFVAESDGTTSSFRIFADKFSITNSVNGVDAGAPFTVDTTNNLITFNGIVKFENVTGSDSLATKDDLAGTNGTVIDGSAIYTGTINADRFMGDSVWTDGSLRSSDYSTNLPYTTGFLLDSNPSTGNPNIYGAHIKGGTIEGISINAQDLRVVSSSYPSNSGVIAYSITSGNFVGQGYGSNFLKNRVCSNDSQIVVTGKLTYLSGPVNNDNINYSITGYLQYRINSGSWVTVDSSKVSGQYYSAAQASRFGGGLSFTGLLKGSVLPANSTISFRVTASTSNCSYSSTGYMATLNNQ